MDPSSKLSELISCFLTLFLLLILSPIDSQTWTFKAGNQTTSAPGSFSGLEYPGSRYFHTSAILPNGSMILFGGFGIGNGDGTFNDLWRYDLISNTWVYVNGNQTINAFTVFSTIKGNGFPGARYSQSMTLHSNGSLFIFGGDGFYAYEMGGYLNEVWRFDPDDNLWYCRIY